MKKPNKVKTYRVEILSFVGPGLIEDTTWKLHSVHNKIDDVYQTMTENHFVRAFECTPNGREFLCDNLQGGVC
jgi:hypothetical protein